MGFFNKEPKEYIESKLNLSDRLPIGSVITLKNLDEVYNINSNEFKKYMERDKFKTGKYVIIDYSRGGYTRSNVEKNKYYAIDYQCSIYPTGFISDDYNVFFIRADDIEEVVFRGFENNQRKQFLLEVDNIIEGSDNNG